MNILASFRKMRSEEQILLVLAIAVILFSLFYDTKTPEAYNLEHYEPGDDKYIHRKKSFVLFYVPWCGYCKNVLPIWDQLARKYQEGDINVMKLDCEADSNVAQKHQVDTYPTIRYYPEGTENYKNYITYIDSRDLSSFTRWLDKMSQGRMGEESSKETFKNANSYSAPIGYNEFETFEPFDSGMSETDKQEQSWLDAYQVDPSDKIAGAKRLQERNPEMDRQEDFLAFNN